MKTLLFLALCVVLSFAAVSISPKLNKNVYDNTVSTETVFVTNENPYVSGKNSVTDLRVSVSVVGKPPKGSSLIVTPLGAPVVGAVTAGSYAPFYFEAKGNAGVWMLKVTASFTDENGKEKTKDRFVPYVIKPKLASKEVFEEGDPSDFSVFDTKSSGLQSRATCPAGSTTELAGYDCNFNAVVDQKQYNSLGFIANTVNVTSVVALNATSSSCIVYKADMSLQCTPPIPKGYGCGVNFPVKCGGCGPAALNILIYYKTSAALGSPTKVWNSGSMSFIVTATANGSGCRRDVQENAVEERSIESGRMKKIAA